MEYPQHPPAAFGTVDYEIQPPKPWFDMYREIFNPREGKRTKLKLNDFSIDVVWPKCHPASIDVDYQGKKSVVHAVVHNEKLRAMLFDRPLGHFASHLKDNVFVEEYHTHLIGLINQWSVLCVPLLKDMNQRLTNEKLRNQLSFADNEIWNMIGGLANFNDFPLGMLKPDFIRMHVQGMSNFETSHFVSILATCSKFELYSYYVHPSKKKSKKNGRRTLIGRVEDGKVSGWRMVTKVYQPRLSTPNPTDQPFNITHFAFGSSFNLIPLEEDEKKAEDENDREDDEDEEVSTMNDNYEEGEEENYDEMAD